MATAAVQAGAAGGLAQLGADVDDAQGGPQARSDAVAVRRQGGGTQAGHFTPFSPTPSCRDYSLHLYLT